MSSRKRVDFSIDHPVKPLIHRNSTIFELYYTHTKKLLEFNTHFSVPLFEKRLSLTNMRIIQYFSAIQKPQAQMTKFNVIEVLNTTIISFLSQSILPNDSDANPVMKIHTRATKLFFLHPFIDLFIRFPSKQMQQLKNGGKAPYDSNY